MFSFGKNIILLAGRILLAGPFIYDGTIPFKAGAWDAALKVYFTPYGLPGWLLNVVVVFEIGGGILLVLGLLTRPLAFLFAGFCLLTAVMYHNNLANAGVATEFGKDVGLAAGFLFLMILGAGAYSLDARLGRS